MYRGDLDFCVPLTWSEIYIKKARFGNQPIWSDIHIENIHIFGTNLFVMNYVQKALDAFLGSTCVQQNVRGKTVLYDLKMCNTEYGFILHHKSSYMQ